MRRLLVIGGVSLDVLHLDDRSVKAAGGAAMYTALAAARCGAQTILFGPRPNPCPEFLQPVAGRVTEWIGPDTIPSPILQFEISYRGGKTEYLKAIADAESALVPESLPVDLSGYDLVHVTPLGHPSQQLSFVRACRQRGAKRISGGTWPGDAMARPEAVRAVIAECEFFFLNGREATAIFGSLEAARVEPGQVLFITLGAKGAMVILGAHVTFIPAVVTTLLDPTGAGDSFCGATLANVLKMQHPIMAARRATALAAEMITAVGPTKLLSDDRFPDAILEPRVQVNESQVRRVAKRISMLFEASPYDFVSPDLPPVNHPQALDYFFAATLQQFSFWSLRDDRYHLPLIATIAGVERKGSDYLWAAITRQLLQDPEFCSPERQAGLSREGLRKVFRADNGEDPMPALDLHLDQARQYGRDMLALGLTPQLVLETARASSQPLQTFLMILDQVGGYKEDPLRKKSLLLAMILNDRPEVFLPLRADEEIPPIMDYHFQRACLRIGLVDVLDRELERKLLNRLLVSSEEEWAVRYPSYLALKEVVTLSTKSLSEVNNFLFTNARQICPEITAPKCSHCKLDSVCGHRKDYFQPILRTTFY